jgi:UDP-N-acetylmuramoyl-L-alanyl-D-glutamate--2,6-diaminopimelate ligase
MTRLLAEIDVLETRGDPDAVEVLGIEHDSRRVEPGALFCCLPGRTTDGHDHVAEAVARGAVGLVCEREVRVPGTQPMAQVRVAAGGARPAMARLAAAFWGHPSRDLVMVGVTGTNGKTTVTHLVGAVTAFTGRPSTVLGTLSGVRTTPEATDLQRSLAAVRDAHPGEPRPVVAMEVSSHALAQSRVDGIVFDVAVFTNLSHDHLDFHGTMEAYFDAKASLFEPARAVRAVVNADDPWGRRLVEGAAVPTVAVRDDQATDVRLEAGRSRFTWREQPVTLPLTGLLNVRNALLAAETVVVLGAPPRSVADGLATAETVPGRLEIVAVPGRAQPFAVLVDFAHSPAALEGVLSEARRLASPGAGRVLVVFGCGGERDRAKRPLMARVAGRLADLVVVTSDNPRHEDPMAIIAEVLSGFAPSAQEMMAAGHVEVEPDRRRAIERALRGARAGDVVVVAGKGHETVQQVGDRMIPFDDRQVAAEVLMDLPPAPPASGS